MRLCFSCRGPAVRVGVYISVSRAVPGAKLLHLVPLELNAWVQDRTSLMHISSSRTHRLAHVYGAIAPVQSAQSMYSLNYTTQNRNHNLPAWSCVRSAGGNGDAFEGGMWEVGVVGEFLQQSGTRPGASRPAITSHGIPADLREAPGLAPARAPTPTPKSPNPHPPRNIDETGCSSYYKYCQRWLER